MPEPAAALEEAAEQVDQGQDPEPEPALIPDGDIFPNEVYVQPDDEDSGVSRETSAESAPASPELEKRLRKLEEDNAVANSRILENQKWGEKTSNELAQERAAHQQLKAWAQSKRAEEDAAAKRPEPMMENPDDFISDPKAGMQFVRDVVRFELGDFARKIAPTLQTAEFHNTKTIPAIARRQAIASMDSAALLAKEKGHDDFADFKPHVAQFFIDNPSTEMASIDPDAILLAFEQIKSKAGRPAPVLQPSRAVPTTTPTPTRTAGRKANAPVTADILKVAREMGNDPQVIANNWRDDKAARGGGR